jgi:hypothetical protein
VPNFPFFFEISSGSSHVRSLKGPLGCANRTDESKDTALAAILWQVSEGLAGHSFSL